MNLDQTEQKLLLVSRATWARVIGAGFLVLGLGISIAILMSGSGILFWLVTAVWAALFVGTAVVMLLEPDMATEFDLRARRATLSRRSLIGATQLSMQFAAIASLGLVRHRSDEGDTYLIEMTTAEGARCRITPRPGGSREACNDVVSKIQGATGLQRLDRDGYFGELFEKRARLDWKSP
jgi:hypothetical protein